MALSSFNMEYIRVQMMSLYEEQMLFRQLRQQAERNALNPELRRLYRKLSLRNTKRSVGEEPFNFDRLVAKLAGQEWSCPISRNNSQPKVVGVSNVLDRFQKGVPSGSAASDSRLNISFRMRLFGSPEDLIPPSIVSPYTGRYISIRNICIFLSISSHRRAELFHCFLFCFRFLWLAGHSSHSSGGITNPGRWNCVCCKRFGASAPIRKLETRLRNPSTTSTFNPTTSRLSTPFAKSSSGPELTVSASFLFALSILIPYDPLFVLV